MARFARRDLLLLLAGLGLFPAVYLGVQWKANGERHGQGDAEPFRIAGNFYFVGASDVSIFLITGPDGHVVIDGGYPIMAPMIVASIAKLGFDIKDVKALLNTEPRPELAGGLAALQQMSGAKLWTSDVNAAVLAAGGDDPDAALPIRVAASLGIFGFPAPRVDHTFRDGDTIRVGPIAVTAHTTGGGARGCTTWTFPVSDGERALNVVHACGLGVTMGFRYREQTADIERSLRVLRSLPADIWVTPHGRSWGRYRKFVASAAAKNPRDRVAVFVDREGYREFVDAAEAEFRGGVVH